MTSPLPMKRDLNPAYISSLVMALGIAFVSVAGLVWRAESLYADSQLVLISGGADAANLVLPLPILLGAMWLARRDSLIGLLLWAGVLFYTLYAYVPYLVGAPFSVLFFVYAGLVTLSAFTVIGILASIDAEDVRQRLAGAPARGVGAALVVIGLAAYAGLTATAVGALGDPAREAGTRPLAVADWALGTPVLLLGGALLWLRVPLGYVAATGLLLVSALGGVVFALAAVLDNLLSHPQTELAVIAVHLVISAVSLALLAWFVRGATGGAVARPTEGEPRASPGAVKPKGVGDMNVLVVYASQFGNTERLARAIGSALEPRHTVRVVATKDARSLTGDGVDLLLVGAPTQMFGRRLIVRSFLDGLKSHGFRGRAATAFDTRMGTPTQKNAAASETIAARLQAAGCQLVVPPESFLVAGFTGPLVEGEEQRAKTWALDVVERLTVVTP
jgi:flavodoxin